MRLPLLAFLAATPAAAFSPPTGCEGVLTVQYSGCLMEHIWQCDADPEGYQWMALFTDRGPFQLRQVDRDFQWLETHYLGEDGGIERMLPNPADPADLTELLETGEDLYDFVVSFHGQETRYQGYDRLTGERVTIDGEPLLRTEMSYQALDASGKVLRSRIGRQYVLESDRVFLFGTMSDPADADGDIVNEPLSFHRPGDDGFMVNRPVYHCGDMLSFLESDQEGGA